MKKFYNKIDLIGTGIFSSDQFIAKKIFQCKPDWLWICLEHSPYSLETIAPIAIDARLNGIMPIIGLDGIILI